VYGAPVVAFNPATRALVASFTLNELGEFSIAGLESGSWILRAEPIDDADVSAFFAGDSRVDVNFGVAYLDRLAVVPKGGNAGSFEIKLAAR